MIRVTDYSINCQMQFQVNQVWCQSIIKSYEVLFCDLVHHIKAVSNTFTEMSLKHLN